MLDTSLLNALNSGNSIAFIGAGPSTALGVLSWEALTRKAYQLVQETVPSHDVKGYRRNFTDRKYPEIFTQVAEDVGYPALVTLVRSQLTLTPPPVFAGSLYDTLARWPFAFYLTTNLDNLLSQALQYSGTYCVPLNNSPTDIATVRATTRDIVLHLHGQLQGDPNDWVLTSTQYHSVLHEPQYGYLRHKIQTLFEMFTIFIFGYSLNDPDISFLLSTAKEYSDPTKPIYMFVSDATDAQIKELHRTKNILAYNYNTIGGAHHELRSLLRPIDRFTVPRQLLPLSPPVSNVLEAAGLPLYLFTTFQLSGNASELNRDLYRFILLTSLSTLNQQSGTLADIIRNIPLTGFSTGEYDTQAIQLALMDLEANGDVQSDGAKTALTDKAKTLLDTTRRDRALLEERVFGQAALDLTRQLVDATQPIITHFVATLKDALVDAFDRRGLDIARAIIAGNSFTPWEATDLFDSLKNWASGLQGLPVRALFIDYVLDFLVKPTAAQREYLWHLSQGYFAYHALKLDPRCAEFRLEHLQSSVWLIDASVILPLIAKGSHNNGYADDFFQRIKDLNVRCFTTEKLFDEIEQHYQWAMHRIDEYGHDPLEFMRVALVKPPYKQNLFIDGFVRRAADDIELTLARYLDSILDGQWDIRSAIQNRLSEYNVRVIKFSEWPGFQVADYAEVEETARRIEALRKQRGTYRSNAQVIAEAEVLVIATHERDGRYKIAGTNGGKAAYFISQSLILNLVDSQASALTWKPETFYRYLSTFHSVRPSPELLAQCMLQDFYYAGIEVVDSSSYSKYFRPQIGQANLDMQRLEGDYDRQIATVYSPTLAEAFDRTPDLEKPLFATMVLAKELERSRLDAAAEKQKTLAAEKRASSLEGVAGLSQKERAHYERLKAQSAERARRHRRKRGK